MGKAEQRERSHREIVRGAAALVRARGVVGASVEAVMARAGLTRGGFYAHFDDKAALLAAAIGRAFDEAERNLFGGELEGHAWAEAAAARYLSPAHVEHPERGCAVPALAGEMSREAGEERAAFAAGVERILARTEARLGGPDARARAIGFLATLVGGLTLARALGPSRRREVLDAARAAALEAARPPYPTSTGALSDAASVGPRLRRA